MEENAPEYEEQSHDFIRSTIAGIVGVCRIIAILAALAFVAAGAVLAFEFFYFVKDIISNPADLPREWQAVLHGPEQSEGDAPAEALPAPQESVPPVEAPPSNVDEPALPAEPAVPAAVPAGDETIPASGPEDSAPPPSVSEGDVEAPSRRDASPASEPAVRTVRRSDPWLELAEQLLAHLETGRLGWFAGMCFLVAFCWILGKVPVVMLSTGTKVLVDLFKVGRD